MLDSTRVIEFGIELEVEYHPRRLLVTVIVLGLTFLIGYLIFV